MSTTYHKPTRAEKERRISYAARLLGRALHRREILQLLRDRFGISARTSENYLAEARVRLAGRFGRSLDEHRLDAFSFYQSVLRDPAATNQELLLAQKRIDKLLGLELPSRPQTSDSKARSDMQAAMRQAALRDPVAADLLARLAERLGALSQEALPSTATPLAG